MSTGHVLTDRVPIVAGASALVLPAEPSTILSPAPAAAETRIEEGYHLDIIEDEEDEMEESLDSFNWTDPQEGVWRCMLPDEPFCLLLWSLKVHQEVI